MSNLLPVLLLVVAVVLLVVALTYDGDATWVALAGAAIAVASVFVVMGTRKSR